MAGTASRPRGRLAELALFVFLVLSLTVVSVAIQVAPAGAFSNFAITVTSDRPLIAGSTANVTVTVYNAGPDAADTTSLEVALPAGITTADGAQCVDPNPCQIGGFGLLNFGESESRTIRVQIDPDYVLDNGGGTGLANASFQTSIDYDAGSQSNNRVLQVGEESDLRVRKYVNPSVADAGENVLYSIDVDNLGPSTARAVTIRDTLFAGFGTPGAPFTILSCAYSVSQGGGTITQFNCLTGPIFTSQFGNDVGTMATSFLQPIGVYPGPAPADPPVVGGRLRAAFILSANQAQTFDNEVRVMSSTHDPDASNNIASVSHSVEAVADLAVEKEADVASAMPGDEVTYTVTATNLGPSDAVNTVVRDRLPGNVELVSATTPDGVCVGGTPGDSSDPVTCLLGTIDGPPTGPDPDPPFSETVTIVVRVLADVPDGGTVHNEAFVSSDTPDRENSNDGAVAIVDVEGVPHLFNPVAPVREFDTRDGTGGVPVAKIASGGTLAFTVTGVNGVPSGAAAVALNVTVDGPVGSGFITVYPCASPRPVASNLNYEAGQTVANAVIATVDPAGAVCFYASTSTDLVVDVSGWFRSASGLTTMNPVREFDTRDGTGGVPTGARAAGSTLTFKVTGVNGVPGSGVAAVALNVTAVSPSAGGFVTVFPCGGVPVASNLNYVAGQTVPNLVVAPVSPQGTVCFYTHASTQLVADVSGWFATGSEYNSVNPSRVFDTRNGLGGVPVAQVLPGGTIEMKVTGKFGIPESGVGAVVLNVTTVNAQGGGFVTVYPCGDRPWASNVNLAVGRAVPNAVIAPVSPSGSVCFYTSAQTDLVADISGWFVGDAA